MTAVTRATPLQTLPLLTLRPTAPPPALSAFGPLAEFSRRSQMETEMGIERTEGVVHARQRGGLSVRFVTEELRAFEQSCSIDVEKHRRDQ